MAAVGTFKVLLTAMRWSDWTDLSFADGLPTIAAQVPPWYAEASYGRCNLVVTIAPMVRLTTMSTAQRDGNLFSAYYGEGTNALRALGFDPATYNRQILTTPGFTGAKGYNVGNLSVINCGNSDYELHANLHELGHSFGLWHAASVRVGSRSGSLLTIAPPEAADTGVIAANDTGDNTSTMGYVASRSNFSVRDKLFLGWLDPRHIATHLGETAQFYDLTPTEVAGGALYGVRVPMAQFVSSSPRSYYIEYRRLLGIDAGYPPNNGVQIRSADDYRLNGLILSDAISKETFAAGESMTDSIVQIDVIETTPTYARVVVRKVGTTTLPPPSPTGNTQMLIDTVKAEANALVLGQITKAQLSKFQADVALLVADAVAVPAGGGNAATFLGTDTTTQGNWRGAYGNGGRQTIGDSAILPTYAVITPAGKSDYTWASNTSDPRALQLIPTGRIAACWYSPGAVGGNFSVDVNLTDGQPHRIALYALDWDGGRSMRIDVLDGSKVLDSQTVNTFKDGVYLKWTVQGHVVFKLTCLSGYNAALSGVFVD